MTTNLHDATIAALRTITESNRRVDEAVREVTRAAQVAEEQARAAASQLQKAWAMAEQVTRTYMVPKLHIPEVYLAS
jgi:hypothetical protein